VSISNTRSGEAETVTVAWNLVVMTTAQHRSTAPASKCDRYGDKGWAALTGPADELAKADIDAAFRAFQDCLFGNRDYGKLSFTIVRAAEIRWTWEAELRSQAVNQQYKDATQDAANAKARELADLAPRLRALGVTVNLHGRVADVAGEETTYMQTFDVILGESRPEVSITREGLLKLIALAEEG
jgi:hypothetical protein